MLNLADQLNVYCSQLLGEKVQNKISANSSKSPSKNHKRKNKKCSTKSNKKNKTDIGNSISDMTSASTKSVNNKNSINNCTNNVSQSPQNDVKKEKNITKLSFDNQTSFTDDGFKIISSIPSDDSDISDAFESNDEESLFSSEEMHSEDEEEDESVGDFEESNNSSIQEDTQNTASTSDDSNLSSIKPKLRKLIEDFDMTDRIMKNEDSQPCLKSLPPKKNREVASDKRPKTVAYQDLCIVDYSKKKPKKKKLPSQNTEIQTNQKSVMTPQEAKIQMKKARYEVFKFGMSGLSKEDKQMARINTLVKLGARPPPKKCVNYKEFIEERKAQKERAIQKREEDRHLGIPVKKNMVKKVRKETLNTNPLMGKFKDGVLNLSKKDIEKLNT